MSSLSQAASSVEKRTNARYWIVVMLFIVTSFNYGDRATLSIAGSEMAKDIGLDPVGMGYVFSAFSWAYVIGQIPGGWLLDRFGSKRVYFWSIFIWSMFTLLQGFVDIFSGFGIIVALFTLRFLVGLAEAPSFPGNSRIVAAWFPAQERGTAVSIFNSAQYFATVIFAPIMGWLTHGVGWSHVFFFMGGGVGENGMAEIGIFVGTMYGNSLLVAEEAEAILTAQGHKATVFEDPELSDWLPYQDKYVLVVTSTTGQGDLPDSIVPLFQGIKDSLGFQPNLRYGVIALGDSSYVNFCNGGKQFDALLQEQSAQRVGEMLLIDASENPEPETESNPWVEQWGTLLS